MYLLVDNHLKDLAQAANDADPSVSAADVVSAIESAFATLQQQDPALALSRRRVMALVARGELASALHEAIVLVGSHRQSASALACAPLPPQYLMSFFAQRAD